MIGKKLMNEAISNSFSDVPERIESFIRSEQGQAIVYAAGVLIGKGAQTGLGLKGRMKGKQFKITGVPLVDEFIAQFIAKEAQKRFGLGEKTISDEGHSTTQETGYG